jgi:TetR/AcrR family transcriptional regulator, transcriptional repressor for nem operon
VRVPLHFDIPMSPVTSRRHLPRGEARAAIIAHASRLMRGRGFASTSVDEICLQAGVTKGAFFHHFASKEALVPTLIEAWVGDRAAQYGRALEAAGEDPLIRLEALFGSLRENVREPPEGIPACLLGMLAQELSLHHEPLRDAFARCFAGWTDLVAGLLAEAKVRHPPVVDFDPAEVAWMLNSLWQGTLLVAKSREEGRRLAEGNLEHARAYLRLLFHGPAALPGSRAET